MRTYIIKTFFAETAPTHTKPESIFATISAFAPVFGFLFAFTAGTRSDIASLILVGATVCIGIGTAIAAWVRREKSPGLLLVASFLNASLLLCFLFMIICFIDPE